MDKQKRDFMNEMYNIIREIDSLKPEPEVCNVSCPPLGCPLGPCPGMCCLKGICDPCCVSKMPCDPSPRCYVPCCLKDYAMQCNANRSSHPCGSSSININRENQTIQNSIYSNFTQRCQPGIQQPCPSLILCQLHRPVIP